MASFSCIVRTCQWTLFFNFDLAASLTHERHSTSQFFGVDFARSAETRVEFFCERRKSKCICIRTLLPARKPRFESLSQFSLLVLLYCTVLYCTVLYRTVTLNPSQLRPSASSFLLAVPPRPSAQPLQHLSNVPSPSLFDSLSHPVTICPASPALHPVSTLRSVQVLPPRRRWMVSLRSCCLLVPITQNRDHFLPQLHSKASIIYLALIDISPNPPPVHQSLRAASAFTFSAPYTAQIPGLGSASAH